MSFGILGAQVRLDATVAPDHTTATSPFIDMIHNWLSM